MSQTKECSTCRVEKPIEEFPFKNKARGWRRGRCFPCQAAYWREWRDREGNAEKHRAAVKRWRSANADTRRAEGRRRYYGLSPEDVAVMLARQNRECAICTVEIHDGRDGFCVDHDHATGRIRGLLCRKCNVMLGMVDDRPEVLASAIRYLEVGCPSSSSPRISVR